MKKLYLYIIGVFLMLPAAYLKSADCYSMEKTKKHKS